MYDEIEFEIQDETSLEFDLEKEAYLVEPKTEKLEVIPSKEQQEFKPVSGTYYNDVVVEKIPDEYVIPKLSKKTITKNGTYKASDDDLDGYDEIKVETSGVDINDYFDSTIKSGNSNQGGWINTIKKLKTPLTIDDTSCAYMFYFFSGTDIPQLDTNNVVDMNNMFRNCRVLTELDLSNFNTSKVTNMSYMFYVCNKLTSLNLSSFDTSKVTNMSYMFYVCDKLTSLNLSSFDTSKVTNMSSMFSNCINLINLNLDNFNTENVINTSSMFDSCKNLISLDLSSFNTSKVTNMQRMFSVCTNLTNLNLSSFNTDKVTNMYMMFYACNNLTSLNLSNFDTSNVTNMSYMFEGCKNLTHLDIRNFDFSKVTSHNGIFNQVPTNCLIIVKDNTAKEWITSKFTTLTNVKIVAELEEI